MLYMNNIYNIIKSTLAHLKIPKEKLQKKKTIFALCSFTTNTRSFTSSFYKYDIVLKVLIDKEVFTGTFTTTSEQECAEQKFTFLRLDHAEFKKTTVNSIEQVLLSKKMQSYDLVDEEDFIALANSLIAKILPHLQDNALWQYNFDKDMILKTIDSEFHALFEHKGSEEFRAKLREHFVLKQKQEIENAIIAKPNTVKKVVKI